MNFDQFLNESSKPMGLSIDKTKKVAELYAKALSKADGSKCTVNAKTLEEDSFDIDCDGEEFDGGSYTIHANGDVVNAAVPGSPVYGKWNDSVDTIVKNLNKLQESFLNEDVDYAVMLIGGSVGDTPRPRDAKGYVGTTSTTEELYTKEKAKEKADRMNKNVLTPGEKKHYGLKYIVVPVKDGKFIKESVVTEASAFMAKDVNKTVDFLNDETGGNPGYLFFGEDDDIEKFDKLWKSRRYQVALDMLAQDREIEAQSIEDVKLFIKESAVNEGDMKGKKCKKCKKGTYKETSLMDDLRGVLHCDKCNDEIERYVNESVVNERNITIKRQYTANRPAVTVGKAAKVRNRMLEAIKDGKLSQEDFNNILKEMTTDSKRWLRRNAQCFNVSEDGITLSKTGSRILKNVMVSEATMNEGLNYKKLAKQFVDDEWLDVDDNIEDLDADEYFDDKLNAFNREELGNSKEFDNNKTNMSIEVKKLLKGRLKQIFEATEKAPKIWVPGGFDKAIAKYPNQKITRKIVLDAALKWDVNPEDAIQYVEYAWMVDLDENKNNNDMNTKFIYESFAEFVENKLNEGTLNEAFKSAKLSNLFSVGSAGTKDLAGAFYNFSKLAIDKIEDYDIIEMDPQTARKEKRANAVYFYIVTNQKVNPYAETSNPSTWNNGLIQSNTLLAITNGQNEWYSTAYNKYSGTESLKVTDKRENAAGFDKRDSKRYDGSGITSITKVAELADTAYVIDLDVLKARYSTQSLTSKRAEDKRGATAFQNDKDFKAANKARYNEILAQKAAAMPMDSVVLGAIDTLATQIKDALTKGEKGRYGELIIGLDPKGREIKMSDASNLMKNILNEYDTYVRYTVDAEKEEKSGYSGKFYEGRLKESAKTITDYVKKVDAKNYAW